MSNKLDFLKIFLFSLLLMAICGYRFGSEDHVSQFPSVLHLLDQHLYQQDFANQAIFPPYLKVALHALLFLTAKALNIPVEYIYFLTYFLVIYTFLAVSYLILGLLKVRQPMRELALVLLIPFAIYYPSISHFHIIKKCLVPYVFVVPICLLSIYFFLQERFSVSSLFLSFAFLVHQQIGLILFFALSFSFITYPLFINKWKRPLKTASIWWFLPFLVIFIGYFIFIQEFGSHRGYPWFDPSWGQELSKMVKFRVPHHLLLSYTKPNYLIGFTLSIMVTYYLGIFHLRESRPVTILCLISAGLLILIPIGYTFTEIYPLPVAFGLYLFRGDVFIRLIAFFIVIAFIDKRLDLQLDRRITATIYALSLTVSLLLISFTSKVRLSTTDNEVVEIARCIQDRTPVNSLILAPPDLKGLRLYSRRSVLASWKSHSLFFSEDRAREWFKRMQLLCGFNGEENCAGKKCRKECAKSFDDFSNDYLSDLTDKYNADYLIVRKNKSFQWAIICETDHFIVYKAPSHMDRK